MLTVFRTILAILVGIAVGGGVVALIESIGVAFHPLPPGLDPQDHEAMEAYVSKLPLEALLMVLAAWFVGTFAGAGAATAITRFRHFGAGVVVTLFFLVSALVMLLTYPHPGWFMAAAFVAIPAAGTLGTWVVGSLFGRPPVEPVSNLG